MIEIKNLQAGYDKTIILPNISLTIPRNKITALIGQNGCGKSTLLKTISRILPAQKGTISLDGKDMQKMSHKEIAKKMAVLPQSPTAPEYLTVKELVSYGRFPYQKKIMKLFPGQWKKQESMNGKIIKYPHYLVVNVNVHGLRWY